MKNKKHEVKNKVKHYLPSIVIIFILTGNVVAQSNQTTMTRLEKVEDLYLSKKYAQALELVNKVITEEPNNYQAYLQRAQVYFLCSVASFCDCIFFGHL